MAYYLGKWVGVTDENGLRSEVVVRRRNATYRTLPDALEAVEALLDQGRLNWQVFEEGAPITRKPSWGPSFEEIWNGVVS